MRRVSKFETTDGKLYDNELEARQHENRITTLKELGSLLISSVRTGRAESVLREILEESSQVSIILARYRAKTPKVLKEIKEAA